MIQKTIREWGGVPYTNVEADELTQELNDRTVYGVDGYNSIAEIGAKTSDIKTKTDYISVTESVDLDAEKSATSLNTAKRSYPSADETKLSGIEAGATADQSDAEIKTAYENNSDTNAYTDAEKVKVGNLSGTNTGDQDLSNYPELDAANTFGGSSNLLTQKFYNKIELWDGQEYDVFSLECEDSGAYGNIGHLISQAIRMTSVEFVEFVVNSHTTRFLDDGSAVFPGAISTKGATTDQTPADIELVGDTALVSKELVDGKFVQSITTGEPTGSDRVVNMVSLTQAEYNAGTPNATTFYVITDA